MLVPGRVDQISTKKHLNPTIPYRSVINLFLLELVIQNHSKTLTTQKHYLRKLKNRLLLGQTGLCGDTENTDPGACSMGCRIRPVTAAVSRSCFSSLEGTYEREARAWRSERQAVFDARGACWPWMPWGPQTARFKNIRKYVKTSNNITWHLFFPSMCPSHNISTATFAVAVASPTHADSPRCWSRRFGAFPR